MFFKRGSAEVVSLILGTVVIGGLAIAIAGGFASNSKDTFGKGLEEQNTGVVTEYGNAVEQPDIGEASF